MSAELAWAPAIEQLYRAIGITDLISEAELSAGMRQLEAALVAVAFEVNVASARGTPIREAVRNDIDYPHLHRAHASISDILEMSVPLEVEAWVRRVHAMPTPPLVDELRTSLARAAVADSLPRACAARFVLFEGARAALKVAAWRTNGAFEAVGATDEEIDEIAESQVSELIAMVSELPQDVRPFHMLIASAMCHLTETVAELRRLLHDMGRDIVEGFFDRNGECPDQLFLINVARWRGCNSIEDGQRQCRVLIDGISDVRSVLSVLTLCILENVDECRRAS